MPCYYASVIPFRLEHVRGSEYRVEGLDARSEVFADFVNSDLFGTQGLVQLLGEVRRVRAGEEPGYTRMWNVHELRLDPDETELVNEYTDARSARCPTDEFIGYLEAILAARDDA